MKHRLRFTDEELSQLISGVNPKDVNDEFWDYEQVVVSLAGLYKAQRHFADEVGVNLCC